MSVVRGKVYGLLWLGGAEGDSEVGVFAFDENGQLEALARRDGLLRHR